MAISECVLDNVIRCSLHDNDDVNFCMNLQYVPMFKDFYTLPVFKDGKRAGFSALLWVCVQSEVRCLFVPLFSLHKNTA